MKVNIKISVHLTDEAGNGTDLTEKELEDVADNLETALSNQSIFCGTSAVTLYSPEVAIEPV